jgi:MoaA/NifB/PqqE/SkfB family radical SAM enzyme
MKTPLPSKTVSFSAATSNLFFHLLTRCNLRCRHCYINPAQHGNHMLPRATANRWLTLFIDRHPEANLVLLGGEPTLHPDLSAIVRHARNLGYASITVDTNGYLFHDFEKRVLPTELDCLSFSLDGASASTNDAIRGAGSYQACVDGIRRAVARGFATSLIYTVSGANLYEIEQMPQRLVEWGIRRFFIQVIGLRGQSAGSRGDQRQVLRDDWLRVIPAVAQQAARLGVRTIYPKVFLDEGEIFECAGLCADNHFVFPNGRVYRCPLGEDYPLHSLQIREDRIVPTAPINEDNLFQLKIPEGCVMNKLVQPGNLSYDEKGAPRYRVACCMLKEELNPQ